ncbi:MAG TPA: DUF1003 domain-containing protein [Bauldia sp.]|nr:DUF1003 domain-containing protein [Bauldia sp.]
MPNVEAIGALAKQLLDLDEGELKPHERAVIERCVRRLAVSRNVNIDIERQSTFGERLADQVAAVGGSWGFIIGFGLVLLGWMALNTFLLFNRGFDPYPYILLNLCLSTLASVQAPIILMSQNRAAARDRIVATHDYEVNLKAEIEIAALHEKLDQIRTQELATLIQSLTAEVRKKL